MIYIPESSVDYILLELLMDTTTDLWILNYHIICITFVKFFMITYCSLFLIS